MDIDFKDELMKWSKDRLSSECLFQSDRASVLEKKLAEAEKTIEALNNDDTEFWNTETAKKLKASNEKLKVAVDLLSGFDRIGECNLTKSREALKQIGGV